MVVQNVINLTPSKEDISLNCFQVDSLALSQFQGTACAELLWAMLRICNWDQLKDILTGERWTDVEATDSYSCSY